MLQVGGKDKRGYDFRRITQTALSPIAPAAPLVTMSDITSGFYDKPVTLTCQVDSLVPFSVQWYKNGKEVSLKQHFRYQVLF